MGARAKTITITPDASDLARIERIRKQRRGVPSATAVATEAARIGLAAMLETEEQIAAPVPKARRGGGRG